MKLRLKKYSENLSFFCKVKTKRLKVFKFIEYYGHYTINMYKIAINYLKRIATKFLRLFWRLI